MDLPESTKQRILAEAQREVEDPALRKKLIEKKMERAWSMDDAARDGQKLIVTDLNVGDAPWPLVRDEHGREGALQYYDWNHGNQSMKLASYLGQIIGLRPEELEVVKTAALLHDVGRQKPWQHEDPGHNKRGAERAERFLTESPRWGGKDKRDAVVRLISLHTLSGPPPTDPLLVVLWDVDSMEAARLAPKTVEGARIMKARYERLITPFARNEDNQRRWRRDRGWGK